MSSIKVYFSDECQARQWRALVDCAGYWACLCNDSYLGDGAFCVEASELAKGLYFPLFEDFILLVR